MKLPVKISIKFYENIDAKEVWLLDFEATNHICNNRDIFEMFKISESSIKVRDGRELKLTH